MNLDAWQDEGDEMLNDRRRVVAELRNEGVPIWVLAAVTGVGESRIRQFLPAEPSDVLAKRITAAREARDAVRADGWQAAIARVEAQRGR